MLRFRAESDSNNDDFRIDGVTIASIGAQDTDNDGISDGNDNCSEVANADQLDTDNDGIGDVCDTDDDGDGQIDTDETSCGSNPLSAESESTDTDNDNIPDCVDTDDDNDTVLDETDNCPNIANTNQEDVDEDGIGDVCDGTIDSDNDDDGVPNSEDNCIEVANADQLDTDNDGIGDVCDTDDDNDEVLDETDNCPLISNTNQADNDNDGIGNVCDDTPGEPISATLTVTKVVNGGTKSVSDFPLFVSATPVSSGVATTFSAGTYTVSETNQDNYTAVISGDCSSTGIVILETGQSRSCTITNTFTAPQNNNNSGGGSGGGGGGGGTPPSPTLVIIESSIAYSNITENGMTITWDTNLPASSYIVYSLASASDQLDNLDNSGTPPTYGYQFSTPELDINPKTTSHTATLTGMTPNTPYHFRLVSRGSLAFSNEYKMTFGEITQTPVSNPTPIPTPTGGSNNQGVGTSGLGQQVAGGSTVVEDILEENTGSNEGEETSDEIQSTNAIQTAALSEAGGQGFIDWLSANWWWLLLLLILIALIAYYYWREQNKGKK